MEYQNSTEFLQLAKLVAKLEPDAHILEIGSMFGDTLQWWLSLPYSHKVMSIDLPLPPSDSRYARQQQAYKEWDTWAEIYDTHFKSYKGDSHSEQALSEAKAFFAAQTHSQPIDFLFIDGDHTYEGVKKDYEMYSPLVRKGGMVAFHDTHGLEEVTRFWNEVKQDKVYKEIHGDTYGWGIGILWV